MDPNVIIKYAQSMKALLVKILNFLESQQQTTKTAEILQAELGMSKEAAEKLAQEIANASSPVDIIKALKEEVKEDFVTMKTANQVTNNASLDNLSPADRQFFEWLNE